MKKKVLIVSNNKRNLQFLKEILQDMECCTETTANPFEGLVLFARARKTKYPFKVVLVEYLLEKMDGILMGRHLKKIDPTVALMLLPTPRLFENEVRKAYEDFGGFTHPPDTTYRGIKGIIENSGDGE